MLREIKTTLGISLSVIGVPLGMYLNWFYPIVRWSPITMAISVLLIANLKRFLTFRFLQIKNLAYIVGFQLLMMFYGWVDITGAMTPQYLSFHVYIIFLCLAYASIEEGLRPEKLCGMLFYTSLPLSCLGAWACFMGLVNGEDVWQMKQEMDEYAIEAFTVASGALANLFAAYVIRKDNFWKKALFVVSIALDVYVLFTCTKRTPIFVGIIGTAVYMYEKGYLAYGRVKKSLKYVLLLIVGFIGAYSAFDSFAVNVDYFADNFYAGVLNLFGDTSVRDASGSAMARTELRNFAFSYIDTNFSLFNYLFGAGYLFRWLDAPIFEAYLDMGVLGFWCYAYIVIWLPLKYVRMRTLNAPQIFALLICIYPIASCLNSGNPYIYSKYTGICLMVFLMSYYSKRNNIKIPKT